MTWVDGTVTYLDGRVIRVLDSTVTPPTYEEVGSQIWHGQFAAQDINATPAGTSVTWAGSTEQVNRGFTTPTGTTIAIPETGLYEISFVLTWNENVINRYSPLTRLFLNAGQVGGAAGGYTRVLGGQTLGSNVCAGIIVSATAADTMAITVIQEAPGADPGVVNLLASSSTFTIKRI